METLPMIAFDAASPFNCLSVREGVVLFVSFQKQQPHQQVPPKCHTICSQIAVVSVVAPKIVKYYYEMQF